MRATRVVVAMAVLMAGLGMYLAGCGPRVVTIIGGATKSATEERSLTAPHVPDSGIDVQTHVGSVEVVADPSTEEVNVTATVTAFGHTEEEAQSRLQEIEVKVSRRDDQVLEITAEPPNDRQDIPWTCSFVVHVPDVNGCKVQTGNGAVTVGGLGGPADIQTSVGKVAVVDQDGKVTARTGNGAIQVTRAAADVDVNTSVGKVTVQDAAGDVTARTGNGAVAITGVNGAVIAKSSVGRIMLEQVAGKVDARTGNGVIAYAPTPGSNSEFSLQTSVGSVKVRLPPSAGGKIQASTSVGNVTVNGARQPRSVTGGGKSKQIVLAEKGPESRVRTSNGNITVTLQ